MVDPDDTPPEGLPADETPTSPDLATFPCPFCSQPNLEGRLVPTGLGPLEAIDDEVTGIRRHRAPRCSECSGDKIVGRDKMAKFQALRQGRRR